MRFIETHSHLNDGSFDADRAGVIERAFKSGVEKMIEVACSAGEWAPAEALCAGYKGKITAVFGLHPQYVEELTPENLKALSGFLKKESCSGLGEIGLDYYYDNSKKDAQFKLLEAQLAMSNSAAKICVFHARNGKEVKTDNAYLDLALELKKQWTLGVRKRARGVLHCFSGSWEDAKTGLDLGLFLGVNGTFTYKKNDDLRVIVKKAGLTNIVLETDCPYLPVQSRRGQRNDPSWIPEIGRAVAEYLGVKPEELAEYTSANAAELFF
ncbi:MAG: TatD family hydrolase [Elusimicrobiales bacterium]|jgi:TatD DNase family protein